MNKKGQALVEFVLVLPVLIFMLLLFVDIGRLTIMKNHLEVLLVDVDSKTVSIDDKEYKVQIKKQTENGKEFITLKSCIHVTTPGLSKIVGKPACVETSKEIKEE